jgi:hypothetical protein
MAEFHKIASPDKLKNIDASNVDLVLQRDVPLLGPVPYVGGRLSLEIGLIAVKSVDLAAPYVALLERLSTIAGVSVIGVANKFIEPIREGVALLTGSADAASLEVGLSQSVGPPMTGWFVLLRAPRGKFTPEELQLDPFDYQLCDKNGNAILDHSYMIVSIEASESRTDFVQIEEVRLAIEELRKALQGNRKNVEELLASFERTTLNCADLHRADAERIIKETWTRFGLNENKVVLTASIDAVTNDESAADILEAISSTPVAVRATYNRKQALSYARNYWNKSASDNYIAVKTAPYYKAVPVGTVFKQVFGGGLVTDEYAQLPDGSTIPWAELEDCTHFVSCCLGTPPNGIGGGLQIRRDFNTIYGRLSPQRLFDDLIGDGLIDVVCEKVDHDVASQKLAQLQAGDLVFYWHPETGRYRHVGMYLADTKKRIACHTYCRCDQADDYNQAWDSTEFRKYTLAKVK